MLYSLSLCTCRTARWLNHCWLIELRKYVFRRRSDEKLHIRPKSWGGPIHCWSPNPKVGGTCLPRSLWLLRLCLPSLLYCATQIFTLPFQKIFSTIVSWTQSSWTSDATAHAHISTCYVYNIYIFWYYNFLSILLLKASMLNSVNFTSGLNTTVTVVFIDRDFP